MPFDSRLLASVLWLADSALPVGAFSHSFGLEAIFAVRRFARKGELEDLLAAWLECEWAGVDGPAFALAHRAAWRGDCEALVQLDRRVNAMRLPAEWRRGGAQVGRQLLRLADRVAGACSDVLPGEERVMPVDSTSHRTGALHTGATAPGGPACREPLGERPGPAPGPAVQSARRLCASAESGETPGQLCVAAGAVYAAWGVPLTAGLTGYLSSTLQSLVAAAVKLAPLGQVEGQVLFRRLAARCLHLVDRAAGTTDLSQLGGCGPYFEIEGMNHEILETRLFIS